MGRKGWGREKKKEWECKEEKEVAKQPQLGEKE